MRKTTILALVISLSISVIVASADYSYAESAAQKAPPQEIVEAMSVKFVRGVANTATGWVEFPKQIVLTFQEDGVVMGIFVGPLKGVGMTLIRTLTGVGEIVMFCVPAPGFYDPLLEPEYVWNAEKKPEQSGLIVGDANN